MNNKKRIGCILIMVLAILIPAAIFMPSSLAYSGYKIYQEKKIVNSEILGEPEEIVQAFYDAYITYEGNPLVDKTYQSSIILTEDFIAYLDDFIADGMLFDPILCAQDRPEMIITGKAEISGDQATVLVLSNFAGHSFKVELRQIDEVWKINMVVCGTH